MTSEDGVNWGATGKIVYERTYSRVKPDGSRETWPETVERVVDGNLALVDERHQVEDERGDLIQMMTDFQILPGGRHLWASGVKNAQHLFNCWVSGWTERPSEHFEFTFMRLMEGGGVGANYSNRYLADYPPVQQELYVHIVCDDEHPDYEAMREAGVLSTEYDPDWMGAFVIEDSREGWASALVDLIDTHYRDDVTHFQRVYDVSRVRAAGTKLKTFGGRASGPLPLALMLIEVCDILSNVYIRDYPLDFPQGLMGIDAMEIDHAIAQCVVAGGVRRSARMAMMHWMDDQIDDFVRIKQATGSHWTTNISVEVDEHFWNAVGKKEPVLFGEHADNVLRLITEGMVNNGEPGFWDSSLSNVGEPNEVVCTNPCMSRNTWVQTVEGPRKVDELIGKKFVAVVDGKPYNSLSDGFFKTGTKPVYKLITEEGWTAEVTDNHEVYRPDGTRVEVRDLQPGDKIRLSDHRCIVPWPGRGSEIEGYTLGWLIGDGTFGQNAILQSQGKPETERSRKEMEKYLRSLPHRSDFTGWGGPYATGQYRLGTKALTEIARSYGIVKGNKTITDDVERTSWDFHVGLLRGLFDTDGHVEWSKNSGVSVRLSSIDRPMLEAVQRMLSRLGIRASIRDMHQEKDMVCPNTGNTYKAKPSHRLLITSRLNVLRFQEVIGFWHTGKAGRLSRDIDSYASEREVKFEATFVEGVYLRDDDVFDCTIDQVYDFCGNGFYMRDCGEITLMPWEPCNLGHINLAAFVKENGRWDQLGLLKAHKLITRFLIRATFSPVADPKSREVLDRNRRIGVGHLGVASALAMLGHRYSNARTDKWFRDQLCWLAAIVDDEAASFAHQLRIPVPVKKRTVAPTGTIAKLPGVSEGAHPIFSRYFNRRIRFNNVSDFETLGQMIEQGYEAEKDLYAPNTTVITIPTKDSLVADTEAIWGQQQSEELVESADELSLNEMLGMQSVYQTCWADNAVSYTANVDPDRYAAADVAAEIQKFGGLLKGATIFPESSMPQAPYERITKGEYEMATAKAVSDGVDEECASGSCPIR